MRGKSINLFLMDGEASGRIKCTLANWTGIAYKIPRTELDRCKDREDLKQSGVYFLFGTSDITGKSVVYIGQAGARKNGEGILNRLQEHKRNPEKDYWTEAIVFTTSNNSFGPTEISYLENRFCNLVLQANRYEVKNGNDPTPGNITEEKECELEEFIDYAKVIMGTLGHKLFEPITKPVEGKTEIEEKQADDIGQLYLKRTIKASWYGRSCWNANRRRLCASGLGSHLPIGLLDTIPEVIKEKREENYFGCRLAKLIENLLFTSPSYAAMFVIGKSANGLTSWKDADGHTLKSLEAEE